MMLNLVQRGFSGWEKADISLASVDSNDNEDHAHKQTEYCRTPEPRLPTQHISHISGEKHPHSQNSMWGEGGKMKVENLKA